jgi:hypothetical protein
MKIMQQWKREKINIHDSSIYQNQVQIICEEVTNSGTYLHRRSLHTHEIFEKNKTVLE